MKKILLFLFVFFLILPLSADRKKVALVLSGGGAKGVAHVGVLEVLEKAGIPIDYIVGTSMGSIVGGLYSIGYRASELDSIVRGQDWNYLLSDKIYLNDLVFSEKETQEKYLLSFPFGRDKNSRMPSGFIGGQNIYNLFSDLTIGYHDSLDFSHFPIPFACIAANIVDGREVVLNCGNLAQSMRASMAIPGAFTPVRKDSMVLVDGGIVNNFPTDVAKAMGADIIIGVDVQSDLRAAEKLGSIPEVMGQLINILCLNKFQENLTLTDIYIRPDVKGYSAASFSTASIDTLIKRGKHAAYTQWDQLMELKRKIGVEDDAVVKEVPSYLQRDSFYIRNIHFKGIPESSTHWLLRSIRLEENQLTTRQKLHRAISSLYGSKTFSGVTYRLLGGPEYDLEVTLKENKLGWVNLGFRFDSEEMAAILLNTRFNFHALSGSRIDLTARLSKSPYVRLDYALENPFFRRLGLSYMFRYNDFNLYDKGEKVNNMIYRYHMGELSLTDIYLRNFKFQLGLRYEYFDYDPFLYKDGEEIGDVQSEGFVSYYVLAHLETLDQRYYPTRGLSFRASYSLYTDNFASYNGHAPFSALSADLTGVISLTNRLKCIPSIYGRVLIGNDVAYPYLNYMGGDVAGRYMQQQLSFTGINHIEAFENTVIVGKLQLRQRMGGKHYLSVMGNYALQDRNFFDLLGGTNIIGGGIGYSYATALGPVGVDFNLSNWENGLGFYFNLGYYF